MKISLINLLCWLMIFNLSAQERGDSLQTALKTAQGEQKVKTLNELFKVHVNTDPVKAMEYTREALALALDITDERGMAASYNNMGVAYRNQGAFDVALKNYLTSLQLYQKIKKAFEVQNLDTL